MLLTVKSFKKNLET